MRTTESAEAGAWSRRAGLGLLFLLLLTHLSALVFLRTGYKGSDAAIYASHAYSLVSGAFEWQPDGYTDRLGVWVPVAVVFSFLEPSPFVLLLWPMFCSLVTLALVYSFSAQLFGRAQAVAASFLFAVSAAQVAFASNLNTESMLSCLFFAGVYALWRGRRAESTQSQALFGTGAAVLFGCAFLVKLAAYWVGLFLVVLLVRDLWRRRNAALWIAFCLAALVFAAVYFGAYAVLLGDPLTRFHALFEAIADHPWSFDKRSPQERFERLTYGPPLLLLLDPGYAFAFILTLAYLFDTVRKREWGQPAFYVLGYGASLFFLFWFGSTSYRDYDPLILNPRYALTALPALCVLGGEGLVRLVASVRRAPAIGGVFVFVVPLFAAGALLGALVGDPRAGVWLGAATGALVVGFASQSRFPKMQLGRFAGLGLVAFLLIACVPLIHRATVGGAFTHTRAENRLFKSIASKSSHDPSTLVFYSGHRAAQAFPLYFAFEVPETVQILDWNRVDWQELDALAHTNDQVLVYVNRYYVSHASEWYGVPPPPFVDDPPDTWNVEYDVGPLTLFRVSP